MPRGSDASRLDGLPVFEVKVSEDWPTWLLVTCPRNDCPGNGTPFLVKRAPWRRKRVGFKGTVIIGRPCAYCGAYGRLP